MTEPRFLHPDDADEPPRLRGVLRHASLRTEPLATADLWTADFPMEEETREPELPDPSDPIPELAALRADWLADAEARFETALEEARAEAYRQGYEAARTKLEAAMDEEIRHHKVQAREMVRRLQALWLDGVRATEPLLARLAVEAAETVLALPLPSSLRAALAGALAHAVEEVAGAGPAAVHLHPVDLLRLQETGLSEQLTAAHPALRWVPHPDLHEGEWRIEAPAEAVHFVRAELFDSLRRHLQLGDDPAPRLVEDDEFEGQMIEGQMIEGGVIERTAAPEALAGGPPAGAEGLPPGVAFEPVAAPPEDVVLDFAFLDPTSDTPEAAR